MSPPNSLRIELLPLGETLEVEPGTPLQDLLFARGVEFPCGGNGRCKGCKVKVLRGTLPISPADALKLSADEIAAGWRLSCCAKALEHLTLDIAQWDAAILTDDSVFQFEPQEGWGVAIDLGTTTVVAQLLDLRTGHVLGVRTGLNAQATHGADIMTRVEFAVAENGHDTLRDLIRRQIGWMIGDLLQAASPGTAASGESRQLRRIVIVGNTVMHHLFSSLSVEPLSHFPFEPASPGLQQFRPSELGWAVAGEPLVSFLPCIGGFVGSDILAGVLATRLDQSSDFAALIDLGTNGEIVVGNKDRMLCASTAAGPAFEGARISMGMRAASGAISEVTVRDGALACRVLGNGPARGICGSGLVDAIAGALELGLVRPNGRFASGEALLLQNPVSLNQWDIRELQLAKGAIAAGLRILLHQWGAAKEELTKVYLAGAFGNYISHASARRIGLLDFPDTILRPAGNTALLGAKMALFSVPSQEGSYSQILNRIQHVSLHEDPQFQETYVEEMTFPATMS